MNPFEVFKDAIKPFLDGKKPPLHVGEVMNLWFYTCSQTDGSGIGTVFKKRRGAATPRPRLKNRSSIIKTFPKEQN